MPHNIKKINDYGDSKLTFNKNKEIYVTEFINETLLYWAIQEKREIEEMQNKKDIEPST